MALLCQAKGHAKKIAKEFPKKSAALLARASLAGHAACLTKNKICKMKPAELKLHLVEVVKAKVTFPKKVQMALVEVTAIGLAREGQYAQAVEVLQPEPSHAASGQAGTVSSQADTASGQAGTASGQAKQQQRKFDPLAPVLCQVEGWLEADLADIWEERLAGDLLFAWMDAGESGSKNVVKFCEVAVPYLQAVQQNTFKEPQQLARVKMLLSMLRCMAALLVPQPGAMGSSSQDVERVAFAGDAEFENAVATDEQGEGDDDADRDQSDEIHQSICGHLRAGQAQSGPKFCGASVTNPWPDPR